MIVLSLCLVLLAAVGLLAGVVVSSSALVFASVGFALLALAALAVGVSRHRPPRRRAAPRTGRSWAGARKTGPSGH